MGFFVFILFLLGLFTGGIGWIPLVIVGVIWFLNRNSETEKKSEDSRRANVTYRGSSADSNVRPSTKCCDYGTCRNSASVGKYCTYHAEEHSKFVKRHCGSKRKHSTEDSAWSHADDLYRKDKGEYTVYLCEICSTYHVGHAKPDDF